MEDKRRRARGIRMGLTEGREPAAAVGVTSREAHLSAAFEEAKTNARIPRPKAHARRARRPAPPASEGAKAPRGPGREEVASAGVPVHSWRHAAGSGSRPSRGVPRARPPGARGFPKRRRLRKRREFLALQAEGRAVHGRHFLLLVGAGDQAAAGEGRIGITVSKKVGSAVKRNRTKRLIREYVRRHDLAPGLDAVVIAKRSAAGLQGYREVARDLARIGRQL